jgi:transcriptional regulator with XRE-family HTH domain
MDMGRSSKFDLSFDDPILQDLLHRLGDNLRKLRQHEGLTQQGVAQVAGLALNTIAEIEQKRVENVRLSTVTALAKALKQHPLDLFR